jgi:hypothetical protein
MSLIWRRTVTRPAARLPELRCGCCALAFVPPQTIVLVRLRADPLRQGAICDGGVGACRRVLVFLRRACRSHRRCQLWNCDRDCADCHQSQHAAAHDVHDVTPASGCIARRSVVCFGRDMKPASVCSGKPISISHRVRSRPSAWTQLRFSETCPAAVQRVLADLWGRSPLLSRPP